MFANKRASHRSALREITKSLSQALSSAQASANLPPTIEHSIQASLDKESKVDDQAAQRLHEDLLNIYHRYVEHTETKQGSFLQALVLLHPYLRGQQRRQEWWKLIIRPVLDSHGRRRVEVERAGDFVLKTLAYDTDQDPDGTSAKQSAHFTKLLLDAYLARTSIRDVEADEYSLENEHVASQLESVLVSFGKGKPQDLIVALDGLVVQTKYRRQALSLLSAFVRGQPPHLDLVSKTSLIEHILQCLMIDSSSTVVQLAITILIMFLPHVPSSIKAHLPRLFLIYSRLLCWDKVDKRRSEEEYYSPDEEKVPELEKMRSDESDEIRIGWTRLEGTSSEEVPALDVSYLFTFLYGLYPMNFTSYVKKPRRYLKNIGFPRAEQLELDQEEIRKRTEPLRAIHLLHPNFYSSTAEEEMADDRWLTSDAADVVADCISLRVSLLATSTQQPPAPPPTAKLPEPPQSESPLIGMGTGDDDVSVTSSSIRSSTASGFSSLSPRKSTSKPQPRRPSRPPTGLDPGDSPTLPPVAEERRPSESIAQESVSDSSKAMLHQQLAILRNDLNFERYLKQQHLAHIGQLQRLHISDATVSANIENLNNTNKSLKSKLAKANDSYAALKKETATSRTQSKKFELDLSSKVRSLRDAERAWHSDESTLKLELEKAKTDCDALQRIVVETEARELLANQKIASMEIQVETVNSLQARVAELQQQLKAFGRKDFDLDRSTHQVDSLRMDLATARMQIQANDGSLERMRHSYDRRIQDLEAQLASAGQSPSQDSDGLSPERRQRIQDAIERAVGSVESRLHVAQQELGQLKRNNIELEIRNQALEGELEPYRSGMSAAPEVPGSHSIPVPRRAGTAPANGLGAHWRNSTGTPTDTDENSPSPSARPQRPIRPDSSATSHPSLRRTSKAGSSALAGAAARVAEESSGASTPLIGPSSAPAKHPPLPVGSALGSPRRAHFSVGNDGTPDSEAAAGSGGSSAPTGTGQGLYLNKKSAWSMDSLDSGQTGHSDKTKASSKSGKSNGSSLFSMGNTGKKTEGEVEEERKKKERLRKQPPKTGGLKGLRGLI